MWNNNLELIPGTIIWKLNVEQQFGVYTWNKNFKIKCGTNI